MQVVHRLRRITEWRGGFNFPRRSTARSSPSFRDRAAQAIESLFAVSLADHYTDLAHHYGRRRWLEWPAKSIDKPLQTRCTARAPTFPRSHTRLFRLKRRTLPLNANGGRPSLAVDPRLVWQMEAAGGVALFVFADLARGIQMSTLRLHSICTVCRRCRKPFDLIGAP